MTTVTVPCSMPVGTAFQPAASTRRTTSSGTAVVATSISPTGTLQQRIAHRAADHARFFAVAIEQREQARDLALFEPGRIAELRSFRHRVTPGTNLPFSTCAGT